MQETPSITTHNYSEDVCVPQLVTAQAVATPDAFALTLGSCSLTYHELDERADRLAHHLVSLGVGSEVIVGVYLTRSVAMVVSALAVLKAGGAYLPLDPAYPAERIAFLVKDAQLQILVTGQCMASNLPVQPRHVVTLDPEGRSTVFQNSQPIVCTVKQKDLAYVIYTSGSTGQPKGVEITHASLLNLVRWHQRAFSVSPTDRATFQASPGFDASVWEIWPYLTAGACICLVDEQVRTDPEALRDWILAKGITISFLPTALAEQMLDVQWPKKTSLRVLLTGADALRHRPPAGLPFDFVNNYGPTECTVVSTSGTVSVGDHGELPTIGTPIDNVQAHVVDESLRPVPVGTPGELLIGGAGVGRGYLNQPELTAQKFIPDPFSQNLGGRLYRTGDLVRYLPNGEIAFLGRIDDQIKIRGYRIEPLEVTTALNRLPDVENSVLIARAEAGEKRLVAYVVPRRGADLQASALRNALAECLPEYMIPSTFVHLEKLPLSANGKLDRAALPSPTPENTLQEDAYEPPQSEVQERLATIVSTLLGVDRVGIDDNFFNRGGHSLLGAQMIAQISDVFGVELSLLSIFNDPTVRGMSAEIERLILEKLENMSEDEAQRLLASQDGD